MSTRVIVKNLPPYLSQDAFSSHFRSSPSIPTDTKLQSSKSGKSRRFGFVGFTTPLEAEQAVLFWNNTYVGATKISAELARTVEEEQGQNYKRKREDAEELANKRRAQPVSKRSEPKLDPKFEEFLKLNQSRTKSKVWANDDVPLGPEPVVVEAPAADQEDSEDEEYQVIPALQNLKESDRYEVIEVEQHASKETLTERVDAPLDVAETGEKDLATEAATNMDDAAWLRARTSRVLDIIDEDDPHERPPSVQTTTQPTQPVSVAKSEETKTRKPSTIQGETVQNRSIITKTHKVTIEPPTLEDSETIMKAQAVAKVEETARLFLRNLPFQVTEDDLRYLFSAYGEVEEIHIPLTQMKQPRGTAFVLFSSGRAAVSAFQELSGSSFQGRLLHILPGEPPLVVMKPDGSKSVAEQRKDQRRKEANKARFNWNSLYMSQDAVLESTAARYGVSKSELLDPSSSSAAVVQALAETSTLQVTRKYFQQHGVNIASFSQTKNKDDSILLFKNFSYGTTEGDLQKAIEGAGGKVRRILMPPTGTIAIVEVGDANEGKQVFGRLAYRKFGESILYVEKGPVNALTSAAPDVSSGKVAAEQSLEAGAVGVRPIEEEDHGAGSTVFVKNLNFDTRANDLARVFESLKGFRNATVKTKPNPKDATSRLSMGFGFVEFSSIDDATSAIAAMQGFKLSEHALELKMSSRKSAGVQSMPKSKQGGTKVIVKNLPFETSKADVQKIFSTYGQLKSVRLPKKFNAGLRGFAFLEFLSAREAANAIEAVTGTHLLGRRMVLEYAQEEKTGEEGVDALVRKTADRRRNLEQVESGKRKIGKVNLDGDDAEGF